MIFVTSNINVNVFRRKIEISNYRKINITKKYVLCRMNTFWSQFIRHVSSFEKNLLLNKFSSLYLESFDVLTICFANNL